mgnify:CR=1 FL=1
MLRVMDTYRKSVDYYNSYGLKSADGSRKKNKSASKNNVDGKGTFWDLNWLDLHNLCVVNFVNEVVRTILDV